MSACDDKLLEEDVGDEDYDLGEGEEEALLAGDYEFDQNEEEPEDILDLEAGLGLDELDPEIQDSGYDHSHASNLAPHNRHYESPQREPEVELFPEQEASPLTVEAEVVGDVPYHEVEPSSDQVVGDEEEEDTEKEEESRDRFRSERTSTVSLKSSRQSYGHIPDTLDQVSIEGQKSNQFTPRMQRGNWGRGRGKRGTNRGSGASFRGTMSNRGPNVHFNQGSLRGAPNMVRSPWSAGQPPNFHHGPGPRGQQGHHNIRPNMGRGMSSQPPHVPPVNYQGSNFGPNLSSGMNFRGPSPNLGSNVGRNFGPGPNMRHNMGPPPNMRPPPHMGSQMPRNQNTNSPSSHGPHVNPNMGSSMGSMTGSSPVGPMMRPMNPMFQNVRPQLGPSVDHQMGHMGPQMGHNMGPQMGPNVGHQINPNVGSHAGPILGPQMHPNMGPQMSPNIRPTMSANMGPPMGPPMGPNMGPPLGHNMVPQLGSNMGAQITTNMGHQGPNMGPHMGQNILPPVGANVDPNMIPHMGRNVYQDGSAVNSQFPGPHVGSNMSGNNIHFSRLQNENISGSQQTPIHSFTSPPTVDPNASHQSVPQQPSYTNFAQSPPLQRVVFNPNPSPEQNIFRVTPDEALRSSGQSSTKIHINPHFRGNMQGGDGRLHLENNQLPRRTIRNHYEQPQFGTFTVHQETRYQGSAEWNRGSSEGNMQQFSQTFGDHSRASGALPEDWMGVSQAYGADTQAASTAELCAAEESCFPPQEPCTPAQQALPKFPPGCAVRASGPDKRKQIQRSPVTGLHRSPSKRTLDSSPGVVPVKQVRLEPKRLKKIHNSNLHEVQTVDTLPDTTTTNETQSQDSTEDEETREYRKKIEEQKRKREEFLRLKEERRVQAALLKQKSGQPPSENADVETPSPSQTVSTVFDRKQETPSQQATNQIQIEKQQILPRRTPINVIADAKQLKTSELPRPPHPNLGPLRGRGGASIRSIRGGRGAIRLSAPSRSNVVNESRNETNTGSKVTLRDVQRGVRIVVPTGARQLKLVQNIISPPETQAQGDSSRNQTNAGVSASGLSKSVAVENLSNSTNATQLRMMGNCIGRVENLLMDQTNKRAVIQFAAPDSAAAFVKRYQRKMVDLSLIKVSLIND